MGQPAQSRTHAWGVPMPPGDYRFSRKFGWVVDRFGVSWQINLGGIAFNPDAPGE